MRLKKKIWHHIQDKLSLRDSQMNLRMAVGDEVLPFASVYTIGYNIVHDFISNNPQIGLLKWTDMDAEEMYSRSNYNQKFEQ